MSNLEFQKNMTEGAHNVRFEFGLIFGTTYEERLFEYTIEVVTTTTTTTIPTTTPTTTTGNNTVPTTSSEPTGPGAPQNLELVQLIAIMSSAIIILVLILILKKGSKS